ncbi:MAG TPA: polymer-forming cytoskeletal protein [Burkholderiales bacterium]|nr:polymer-forming cytoskeletal protein [Burkholderiales bacterium]
MLQKEGLFRRDRVRFTPPAPPATPMPTPAAPQAHPYPAEHKPAARGEARNESRSKEAKLIVGPEIKMKGVEIADCDTLIVEGRIEATPDSRVIQIAEHGVFTGTVAVDEAEIHGRLEGELTVRKQLIVHATGKVSGKVRYNQIKVDEGAELSGEISTLGGAQATELKRAALDA